MFGFHSLSLAQPSHANWVRCPMVHIRLNLKKTNYAHAAIYHMNSSACENAVLNRLQSFDSNLNVTRIIIIFLPCATSLFATPGSSGSTTPATTLVVVSSSNCTSCNKAKFWHSYKQILNSDMKCAPFF